MTNMIGDRFRAAWPRLTAAGSVMGGLVWLLWPTSNWNLEGEPAVWLAASVLGWLYLELVYVPPLEGSGAVPPPLHEAAAEAHPHDGRLWARFNQTVPLEDRAYLREHDFRTPIDSHRFDGLEEVALAWNGADFEFHDEGLRTAFRRLRTSAQELMNLTGECLYATDANPRILSPLTDMDRRQGISGRTMENIRNMNAKGAEVVEEIDLLIRLARDRLGG